jgi:DNA-binding CsgD family transcriptional regulator
MGLGWANAERAFIDLLAVRGSGRFSFVRPLHLCPKTRQSARSNVGRVVAVSSEDLIDRIYEAAAVPSLWTGVLDAIASIAGAEGTMLFAAAPGPGRWIASAAITPIAAEFFASRWAGDNARGARLVPRTDPAFLTDLDAFTREELDREPFYTDFLRPRGLGWCVGTTIRAPSGDTLVFSAERLAAAGPVEVEAVVRLNRLRPHLARAALLSGRLGLERARASVDALQMLGLPAAVLTGTGAALAINPLLEARSGQVLIGAANQLGFIDSTSQVLLANVIAHGPAGPDASRSLPVAAAGDNGPLVAHVVPLRGAALDVFSGAAWLLFMTPLEPRAGLAPDILQALYDLSPAEARIARLLLEGKSVSVIATQTAVTVNTVRAHLKSIFAKTGVNRQVELVRLLSLPNYPTSE